MPEGLNVEVAHKLTEGKRLFGFKGGSGCSGRGVIRLRRAGFEAGNDQSLESVG